MNIDTSEAHNPLPIWDHFGSNIHKDSICYDPTYNRLYLSDFLCNFDVIDSSSGKFITKVCLKEHRQEEEIEQRLTNTYNEVLFSISLRGNFIYVVTNRYVYVVKRNDLAVLTSLKLDKNPIKVKLFSVTKDEAALLKTDDSEVFLNKIVFGFSDRYSLAWSTVYHSAKEEEEKDEQGNTRSVSRSFLRVVTEGQKDKDYAHSQYYNMWRRPYNLQIFGSDNVHSVDVNNALAACAAKDMKVNVFDMDTGKSYSLPGGSKVVKSYIDHPKKPGISEIKVSGKCC